MLTTYLIRGLKAGLVAGLVFGLFVALVGNPLVGFAEAASHGHGDAADRAHDGQGSAVSAVVERGASVAAGVALGLFLGAAFGIAYYFLEPAVPGAGDTKSYLLAAAGFATVSGAPWLAFPPQAPGVEHALPADVRIAWYGGMMVVGALACGAAGRAYATLRPTSGRVVALAAVAASLATVLTVALLAPGDPTTVAGGVEAVYRGVVVFGQLALWAALAGAHAWLVRRADDASVAATLDEDVRPSAD